MRLGVIYEPDSANAHYRAVIPMRALEQRGHTVVWPKHPVTPPVREFLTCDLVHCYRRMDRMSDLCTLSARGVAISFDNDDNYAAAEVSDGGQGLAGRRYNQELHRRVIEAAKLADLTTTPSELLAEQYRAAGAHHVAVIENHLSRQTFGFGSRSKHDGIVVGWVAGREHRVDLERIRLTDALEGLLAVHPELRILTVGLRLPLHAERYQHITHVPFHDLLKITSRLDVGIAPLVDNVFNRSRSNIKLKEYGAGVTAWLASPVGPYSMLGQQEGGMLVADDDWFTALDALIRSPRLRRRLAKRSFKWARAHTIERHVDAWENAFLEAIERRREGQATRNVTVAAQR